MRDALSNAGKAIAALNESPSEKEGKYAELKTSKGGTPPQ